MPYEYLLSIAAFRHRRSWALVDSGEHSGGQRVGGRHPPLSDLCPVWTAGRSAMREDTHA